MAKLNTLSASSNPSVMLFGAPFTGKTLLAGKLAEYFNIIHIDMEAGHDVMFTLPKEWQERIEVISLPDTSSYPIAIETCLKMVKMAVSICEKHGKVGCLKCKTAGDPIVDVDLNNLGDDTIVVFDSATQLTASAIANIVKKEDDMYKLKLDDWGGLSKLMDIFFSHIQNASYKRIVISHVKEAEQEDGRVLLSPVAGSQNFSSNVARFFDHVVYLERKNKKHMVASSTTYNTRVMTGSRTNVAMEDMTEATLLSIFKPEVVEKTVSSASHTAGTQGAGSLLDRVKKEA